MKSMGLRAAFCTFATLVSPIVASPVSAQDRMTEETCAQSWASAFALTGLPPTTVTAQVDEAGWCTISEARIRIGFQNELEIDALRWRASDIGRFLTDDLPPRSLEVYAEGLRVLPKTATGDAVLDYLLAVQASGQDAGFGLSIRWDGVQNAVLIDEGHLILDETNRIDLSGRIDGVDLTDVASLQASAGTMGLRQLEVKTQLDGWFEAVLAMPLGQILLTQSEVPPAKQIADLQAQAIDFLAQIPHETLPVVAQDALSAFITDLPHPKGQLQVQMTAEPTLGMSRFAPLAFGREPRDAAFVSQILDGVRLIVTWDAKKEP